MSTTAIKNATIFHGTDCAPDSNYYWYSWLKNELKHSGYKVETPSYPEINHESIETFLPKVLANHQFDSETVLIGHSAGSPLILSILERIGQPIKQAVLVAGYSMRFPDEKHDPVLQYMYDWQRIRSHSQSFVFINSVDDPWGCDDKQGRRMFDMLGGTQIIRNDGHFGSESQNLPYTTFPLLKSVILDGEA